MSGDLWQYMALNKDAFAYTRSFAEVTLVVIINFSDKDYPININDLEVDFPAETEVVLAGSMSSYELTTQYYLQYFFRWQHYYIYDEKVWHTCIESKAASEPSTTPVPTTTPTPVPTASAISQLFF